MLNIRENIMFQGVFTALITPFLSVTENKNQSILDEKKLRSFIEWQIREGIHGLVPVGTTGESPTLSHQEHKDVIAICLDQSQKRVPVIAGAGSNNTIEAIEFVQHAQELGADGTLVVTPYYNKPNQEGLYQHFAEIAKHSDIPIIIYNIPGRSVIDMSAETMQKLKSDFKNIVGVKDATAKIERVSEQREKCGQDFIQLSGDDNTTLGFIAQGGHGSISVTSNIAPRLCAQIYNATQEGDFRKALSLHDKLVPLHRALFLEPNPAGVKYAAEKLGKVSHLTRLPIVPLKESTKKIIDESLIYAGLL